MLEDLKQLYPWPKECPDVEKNPKGWLSGDNKILLKRIIREIYPSVILELGSFLGMSARFLCEQSPTECTVLCIDHWEGSAEHQNLPETPILYETFLRNCWHFKDKIVPIKEDTLVGMRKIASLGVQPEIVYVDASHDTPSVINDLETSLDLFPKARIVGDDWTWATVKEAAETVAKDHGLVLKSYRTCYEVLRNES